MYAGAVLQPHSVVALQLIVDLAECPLHPVGRSDRAQRVADGGERFDVEIAPFALGEPHSIN